MGTIIDNDTLTSTSTVGVTTIPVIKLSDAIVDESDGRAYITVTLDIASTNAISVSFVTADGTAQAGSDYQALITQTLGFAPGETAKTIAINLIDDISGESGEYFDVVFSSPTGGATLPDTRARVFIGASDQAMQAIPVISVSNAVAGEKDGYMDFVLSLSGPSTQTISVGYETISGTAGFYDYTGISGTLAFAVGETTKTVRVAVANDSDVEGTEGFIFNLFSPLNAIIGNKTAVGTILDNASTPTIAGLTLTGANGPDILVGRDSADVIDGGAGDDFMDGAGGNDILNGGVGNDILLGSAGNDTLDGGTGADAAVFNGSLNSFVITKVGGNYNVRDKVGADGTDTVTNIESLKFADKTVNLTIQAKAAAAPQVDVVRLAELYVAFFNRVPDADGLSYWIDQKVAGQSISQIADVFYSAGVQYSNLTGFSSSMSNGDFVNVVYRNVLGRSGGADAEGLAYWSGQLVNGLATRGSLVSTIIDSAHTFKGNATYGWVADLLDNKYTVAKTFAIDWGLNYNTPTDSISQGMAIAAAVTSISTTAAIALIGVTASELQLG